MQINKPEDAIPHIISYDIKTGERSVQGMRGNGFTATECAQIAKAYAQAVLDMKKIRKVDISANQEPYPDDAWRMKFKEWENES